VVQIRSEWVVHFESESVVQFGSEYAIVVLAGIKWLMEMDKVFKRGHKIVAAAYVVVPIV